MIQDEIVNEYFEWLFDIVCEDMFNKNISYRKLLSFLHLTEFRWIIDRDENRALDGLDLRDRFITFKNYDDLVLDYLEGPCSVLEMMIALAIRCEETITDNPDFGDRTKQWFWGMINNLGLGSMMDDVFDRRIAEDIVQRFLDRDYAPNGKGGLFTIDNVNRDLRTVEIWYQQNWYLNNFI